MGSLNGCLPNHDSPAAPSLGQTFETQKHSEDWSQDSTDGIASRQ